MSLRTASFVLAFMTAALAAPACATDAEADPPALDAAAPPPVSSSGAETDAAPAPDAAPTFPAATAEALQRTLDEAADRIAPGAALVVLHPRHGAFRSAAGVADLATREPLTSAHRFRAGSMLKTAVATAILQQVERGTLSLTATVRQLLPASIADRIARSDAITVRMLLTHTSGIPEFANGDFDQHVLTDPTHAWTLDEFLARIEAQEPTGDPGGAWSYSNSNYTLLGEILTAVAAATWRDTVTREVFTPLGLRDTHLPAVGDATCSGCARGYEPVDQPPLDVTLVDPSMAGAAGGAALVTTPEDLATFLRALLTGALFSESTTRQLLLDFVPAEVPEEAQIGYGAGITRFQLGETEYLGHLGGTAGYQGFMLLDPASGMVLSGYISQRGDLGAFLVPVLETLERL